MTGQSLLFIGFMIDLASFHYLTDSKSDWGIQIRYKLPSKRNNKYEENTDTFNRDGKLCCFLGGSDRF